MKIKKSGLLLNSIFLFIFLDKNEPSLYRPPSKVVTHEKLTADDLVGKSVSYCEDNAYLKKHMIGSSNFLKLKSLSILERRIGAIVD